MTSRQESILEALALNPDLLSVAEKAEVDALMETSEEAAALFVYFTSFYREFKCAHQTFMSERIRGFVESLLHSNRLIRLVPRRARLEDPESGKTLKPRLAASSSGVRKKFELLGSSLSSDGETNIRFIRDQDSGKVLVFCVSANSDHVANAIIMFEETSVFLVTDGGGQASMDEELFEGLKLIGRTVYLRPLTAEMEVDTLDLSDELSAVPYLDGFAIEAALRVDELLLRSNNEDHMILGRLEGDAEWRLIQSHETVSIAHGSGKKLFLRIYG